MDPAEATVAWTEQYRVAQLATTQVAEQQALIQQQNPYVEFVENYVDSNGLKRTLFTTNGMLWISNFLNS